MIRAIAKRPETFERGQGEMPVHVEEMSTEVTAMDGELPLTESQIERLVQIILKRLDSKQREARKSQEAVALKRSAAPPARVGE